MTFADVVNATVHYLVIDSQDGDRIHVFLDRDPALAHDGPPAEAVTLQLLPGGRLGSPVDVAARPMLGRHPDTPRHFREFRSSTDLFEAHFLPVAYYRVCHCWDDYQNPWRSCVVEAGSIGGDTAT